MKKAPCHSFETMVQEARQAPDVDAWVRDNLANNSAETILEYCQIMLRRGDADLAGKIAQSSAMQERVVPDSVKQDDESFAPNFLPPGGMFQSRYRFLLSNLEVSERSAT